ncbi:DNA topoisomerase III [Bacillus cereus group sp. TH43LC]|uniref:DNA topoisomerase 3 n=4 Tax=Bacillus cereus group TaxID=86661 RepID=A0A5M9GNK6_9BACI|nr:MULTISPECIES: DNA topoisomerase III [Bacillus]ACJ80082.1 DNA topoisomerase 3 [Bacillus cereus AH187]ACM10921.1 DNA topoisomerase (DNA topoisomerase I) [Bacillus cereus Q1]EDZ59011.1 DNA topoisomerase 3 [Bacillus cereus H3081.97]EEL02433.1 DNA topoisomerase 3 [Bacillus cereus BDRD-ST26]EJP85679.1 DNA topoisomerase 3 [Bacillus cereus IS075]EJP99371.1 DNA topoisomerase 3 [Bacillus cereus AND1407]EJR07572.1 DNA topoisomerase 3 [Bacillus cereus MSX-A12]EOO91045.1 DNA topoisomerase 3 [Bacillus
MAKSVVIAEKPSVARDIAKVLKCTKKGNGFLEGDKYIVTWALGHLVTLADPETYDNKYKTWTLEDLPMLPERMKLVVIKQTGKQFNAVKHQLTRNDVNELIVATDAGREGELVARWIIEKAKVNKPIKRLWISSVTDKAIKDGFNNLKPGKAYDNLYASAVARSEADWYIGLNATRALTTKFNAQLNCGRVQTPTVAIIAGREDEIKNFKAQTYYGIEAQTNDRLKLTWQDANGNSRSFNKEKIDDIVKNLDKQNATVVEIDKKQKKSFSPGLYDLTELQRDANKKFGYSAKETLNIMQKLYEQHKVLTYPRTDSRYISSDIVGTLPERLKACGVGEYRPLAHKVLQKPIKPNKSFVDDSKVSDHHAIIPTEGYVNFSAFTDKERKIYDLVVKRFLAVLFPAFEYEQLTLRTKVGNETFIARGKTILHAGWKEVYENRFEDDDVTDDVKEQLLPRIEKGDTLTVKLIMQTSGQTKAPARFNEATLLSAMENPTKYMDTQNKQLADTLKSTGGLGTVATRADIIDKLFNSFLIEKRGKDIHITSKGRQLLDLVPEELKSPTLTGEWEQKLEAIAKGKLKKEVFISEMKNYTKEIVSEIKSSDKKYKHDNISTKSCPDCGKPMLEVNGKKGKMLVCQDRECGHRKNVSRTTNARCPQCKKKLELRGEGAGQIFACKCGYREKLSTFQERRKKESGNKADKRDVQKYMKQQKKEEEPLNNAFAEALKKLKFD